MNVRVSWTVESDSKDLFRAIVDSVKLGTLTIDHAASSHGLPVLVADSGEVLGSGEVGLLRILPEESINDDAGTSTRSPLTAEQAKTIQSAVRAGYRVQRVITYQPARVGVSDERGEVAGAYVDVPALGIHGETVIPPEGDSLDCWLGQIYSALRGDNALLDALAEAAREGAAGRSGTLEVE